MLRWIKLKIRKWLGVTEDYRAIQRDIVLLMQRQLEVQEMLDQLGKVHPNAFPSEIHNAN